MARETTRISKDPDQPDKGKKAGNSSARSRRWRDTTAKIPEAEASNSGSNSKRVTQVRSRKGTSRIYKVADGVLELSGKDHLDITALVSSDSVLQLKGTTKSEVLAEMSEAAAKQCGFQDAQSVMRAVLETESRINTKMGPNWATPHARLPDLPQPLKIIIGRSEAGIPYDSADDQKVNLVVLILAREDAREEYLRALAAVVGALRDPEIVKRVISAGNERTLRAAISGRTLGRRMVVSKQLPQVTRALLRNMLRFAKDSAIGAIFINIDAFERPALLKTMVTPTTVIVTSQRTVPEEIEIPARGVVRLPFEATNADATLRLAIVLALGRGLVGRKERVLAVAGPKASNDIDVMRLFNTRDFPAIDLGSSKQEDKVAAGVLERVIEMASRISQEGREGIPMGCCFVIGQSHDFSSYLRQLIINPFRGYRSEELNILDITLEETVKEFASIDGAFIVSRSGALLSAGTYLSPPSDIVVDLPSGLGTRHQSAAMLTACCDCIAVVVSASTGIVTVFFEGKTVLTMNPDAARRVSDSHT